MGDTELDIIPDLRRAAVILALIATEAAIADVALIRRGHSPLTAGLRTKTGKTVLLLIGLHVAELLGPLDPFSAAGRVIEQRYLRGTI